MIFDYKVITADGEQKTGSVDAISKDVAISSLQRRDFVIASLTERGGMNAFMLLLSRIHLFDKVSDRDVVLLSRQLATLFESGVSALKAFRMLASDSENAAVRDSLTLIADDIQSGLSISGALNKFPSIFSSFYVNMVRAGEEAGKLNEIFAFLADYLDRTDELTAKTKNAFIYPLFVIFTFIIVVVLMLTLVIPKLSEILLASGQEIPFYTQVVIGMSKVFTDYGVFLVLFFTCFGFYIWWTRRGMGEEHYVDDFKLSFPYINQIYRKLYLARIADNLDTMLSAGIPIVRALEITSTVVGNKVFEDMLLKAREKVRSGTLLSEALAQNSEIPAVMIQMIRVGEETGKLGNVLKNLAKFYQREVFSTVDGLIGLIEPVMVVALGLAVGILLVSVLIPIYNIAGSL